jgi:hypothetical protein
LFDEQFAQQTGHIVIDELAAVVGMKTANPEGKLFQQGFQHWQQPEFGDLRGGGHDFPLGHLVDGVDVIQPFASVLIALMHRVDAQISGQALRLRLASLANGNRRRSCGLVAGVALPVGRRVAQPVQVRH